MRRTTHLVGITVFVFLGACSNPGDSPDPEVTDCSAPGGSCPFGQYCGDSGLCTADCLIGSDDCGDGFDCGSDGRCFDVGDGPDCPDVSVSLAPQTPTVLVLVDQSGSMATGFGNGLDRYQAVRAALTDPTVGVVATMGDRVNFGASLYMSQGGDAGGACPILTTVAPGAASLGDIDQLFEDNGPNRDTPTAESVTATAAALASVSGPRVIVLATDGDPDTCADPNSNGQDSSRAMSEQAVADAFAGGIKTFVLSVGNDVTEAHLQRLANAGVGDDLDAGTAPFYVANDPAELGAAFNDIILGVRSCEITLDQPVEPARVDEGTVTLNGRDLDFGSDWELTSDTTIELLGDACDELLNTDEVQLSASFPCGIVVQ